jgi:hypothetical protein
MSLVDLQILMHMACQVFILKARVHWLSLLAKMRPISRLDIPFLTFLGQATQIEIALSVLRRPRWPRKVKSLHGQTLDNSTKPGPSFQV